ncbi:MAG: homoserine dehydrogenase [Promethearchaeota archaeon]
MSEKCVNDKKNLITIKCGLIGMGVVGKNVLSIILANKERYKEEYGINIVFTAIFEYDGALINESEIGLDISKILNSSNIRDLEYWKNGVMAIDYVPKLQADIIIETTPVNPKTAEPALSHIIKALESKKHVVTSNKGPFYLKYRELMELAEKNKVQIGFESTVMSAVPCIAIKNSLKGNKIKKIVGVLNGTSNFILDRMTSEGVDFELALKDAQELGYAEADPTLDIEGYDSAGKLVILANHLMGWNKTIHDVKISGIKIINKEMIELAKQEHKVIKHLAIARDGKLEVSLKMIDKDSPLALTRNYNGLYIDTEYAGEIVITGRGAGGSEAAAGIISDLLNICQNCYK